MSNKSKIVWILVVLLIIAAGVLWYRGWQTKQKQNAESAAKNSAASFSNSASDITDANANADSSDQAEQDFNAQCENGEWQKIADVSGDLVTMSGKLRKVYPDDEASQPFQNYGYFLDGSDQVALTGQKLDNLDYFEDREAEVQGTLKSGAVKELAVSQIRCAGNETDKNVISQRNKLLNWIAGNINSVAPKKALYQKWTVDTVDFVDENNVYIEYYDTAEDDENVTLPDNVDTSRKILLEVSAKSDGSFGANVLAYWEMGDEDYVLKTGTDKFEDVSDTSMYQYDSEEKSWTRI